MASNHLKKIHPDQHVFQEHFHFLNFVEPK